MKLRQKVKNNQLKKMRKKKKNSLRRKLPLKEMQLRVKKLLLQMSQQRKRLKEKVKLRQKVRNNLLKEMHRKTVKKKKMESPKELKFRSELRKIPSNLIS